MDNPSKEILYGNESEWSAGKFNNMDNFQKHNIE